MSDVSANNAGGVAFTEREMQMLAWAMQSLKSGPPEIDYEKLATYAGMSNPRSASNAWAKIKAKLATTCPAEGIVVAKKGGPRKKAAGDEDGEGTPKKAPATPRKRAAKKQDVDGEPTPTPKKRGKAAKAAEPKIDVKAEVTDEPEEDVKMEAAPEDETVVADKV